MSTIKSSSEHLTLNADGSGKEVKIQRDGTEVLATTSSGVDISGSVSDTDGNVRSGRKNLIINGGFDVWQRGTTDSYSTSGSYRSADRVYVNASTASCKLYQGVFTSSQTAVAGNPTYYGRLDVQTGDNNCGLQLRLENKDLFANRDFTLSFWAKSDAPKLLNVTIQGYGSTTSVSSTAQTFTATSSWVRYSFTFTLGSTSAVAGSTTYSRIAINQGADDTTTAWKLDIANIQLELGSVATDFEHRSYGEELALCQRYFELPRFGNTAASRWSGADWTGGVSFAVTKRATPTITLSGSPRVWGDASYASATSVTTWDVTEGGFGLRAQGGHASALSVFYGQDTLVIKADAEL